MTNVLILRTASAWQRTVHGRSCIGNDDGVGQIWADSDTIHTPLQAFRKSLSNTSRHPYENAVLYMFRIVESLKTQKKHNSCAAPHSLWPICGPSGHISDPYFACGMLGESHPTTSV